MKLLLDQGLGHPVAQMLQAAGHDAQHVGSVAMATASDLEIITYARAEGRTVITLDADFHALVAVSNATGPTVIRVRIEGLRAEAMTRLLARVLDQLATDIANGALITIDDHGARVRALPL